MAAAGHPSSIRSDRKTGWRQKSHVVFSHVVELLKGLQSSADPRRHALVATADLGEIRKELEALEIMSPDA